MEGFIAGSISGFVQILIGHPFDTYKVWLQTNKGRLNPYPWRDVYLGIRYPLYSNCLMNSVLFSSYQLAEKVSDNPWCRGAISGIASSLVCCPVDMCKIAQQTRISHSISYYRGFIPTLFRETIGTSVYFGIYESLYQYNYCNSFISGGIAGVVCWGVTHPIDTLKSRIQSYQANTLTQAYQLGNLWKGLHMSLLRAVLVNSVGFWVYQTLRDEYI